MQAIINMLTLAPWVLVTIYGLMVAEEEENEK